MKPKLHTYWVTGIVHFKTMSPGFHYTPAGSLYLELHMCYISLRFQGRETWEPHRPMQQGCPQAGWQVGPPRHWIGLWLWLGSLLWGSLLLNYCQHMILWTCRRTVGFFLPQDMASQHLAGRNSLSCDSTEDILLRVTGSGPLHPLLLPHALGWVFFSTNTKKPIGNNWVTTLAPERYMMIPRWCGPSTLPKCRVTVSIRKNSRNTRQDTAAQWTCLVLFWPRNVKTWSVMWTTNTSCMNGPACHLLLVLPTMVHS